MQRSFANRSEKSRKISTVASMDNVRHEHMRVSREKHSAVEVYNDRGDGSVLRSEPSRRGQESRATPHFYRQAFPIQVLIQVFFVAYNGSSSL